MRIEIDTAKDTHEDIRKAIKLLMSLVGAGNIYSNEPSPTRNIFDEPSSMGGSEAPPANPFAAMFGGDAPAPTQSASVKKPDSDPQIELY